MEEISNDELTRRVRLAYEYCKFCYDSSKTQHVGCANDQMMFFFHGIDVPLEGKGDFGIYLADKCIKCFESGYQQPAVANFLESKLSSHLPKKEKK